MSALAREKREEKVTYLRAFAFAIAVLFVGTLALTSRSFSSFLSLL